MYYNINNTNILQKFFKPNFKYHCCILYKKNISLHSKVKLVNEL